MSNRSAESEGTSARCDFARRLRELRILRGFRTARSLARTLQIDENRYTRYERAEVEPDLEMIRRICATLAVSPSELLGPDEAPAARSGAASRRGSRGRERGGETGPAMGLAVAAWELAEAVIRARRTAGGDDPEAHTSPLADMSQTGALYRSIMLQPFEAIIQLLQDPAVVAAPAEAAAGLKQRLDQLVHSIRQGAQP